MASDSAASAAGLKRDQARLNTDFRLSAKSLELPGKWIYRCFWPEYLLCATKLPVCGMTASRPGGGFAIDRATTSSNITPWCEIGTEVDVLSYSIADGSELNPDWVKL
jgi:hypothetical protein